MSKVLDDAEHKPVTMTLNGNKLILKESTGMWSMESSDLDIATLEIEKLIDEKETLALSLSTSISQIEALQKEVIEVNQLKSVILEMLMNERQQRIQLEDEVQGYQEELRDSYSAIVELRKLIPTQE